MRVYVVLRAYTPVRKVCMLIKFLKSVIAQKSQGSYN